MTITVEISARIVDRPGPGEVIGQTTITDPCQADAQLARLLRSIADELDAQRRSDTRPPQVLRDALPQVLTELAVRHVVAERRDRAGGAA